VKSIVTFTFRLHHFTTFSHASAGRFVGLMNTRDNAFEVKQMRMKLPATFTLLAICVTAMGQSFVTEKGKQTKLTVYPYVYIDTEFRYSSPTGPTVIIQNSLPRGGGYMDSVGKGHGYTVFWTRVMNETARPVELTVNFPPELLEDIGSTDTNMKLFLPADTMTMANETLYDYGLADVKSFSDAKLHKPIQLHRTINPKEACMFYVVGFFDSPERPVRTEFILKGEDLFYRIRGVTQRLDSALIPCGQIIFKK
jgi:hypothetical protein